MPEQLRQPKDIMIGGRTLEEILEQRKQSRNNKYEGPKAGTEKPAGLQNADLSYVDLRNADLTWIELDGANLRGADLSGACLRKADLKGACLKDAVMNETDLKYADLTDADLSGAVIYDSDLSMAVLARACLNDASIDASDLVEADMHGADMRKIYLSGSNLDNARLNGADLREARMIHVSMWNADLTSALFGNTIMDQIFLRGAKGIDWSKNVNPDIEACLIQESDKVRVFSTSGIPCSQAYYSPDKEAVIPCTVTYDREKGDITLSFADGGKDIAASKILRDIYFTGKEQEQFWIHTGKVPEERRPSEKDAVLIAGYIEAEYMSLEARGKDGTIVDIEKSTEAAKIRKNAKREIRQGGPHPAGKEQGRTCKSRR